MLVLLFLCLCSEGDCCCGKQRLCVYCWLYPILSSEIGLLECVWHPAVSQWSKQGKYWPDRTKMNIKSLQISFFLYSELADFIFKVRWCDRKMRQKDKSSFRTVWLYTNKTDCRQWVPCTLWVDGPIVVVLGATCSQPSSTCSSPLTSYYMIRQTASQSISFQFHDTLPDPFLWNLFTLGLWFVNFLLEENPKILENRVFRRARGSTSMTAEHKLGSSDIVLSTCPLLPLFQLLAKFRAFGPPVLVAVKEVSTFIFITSFI